MVRRIIVSGRGEVSAKPDTAEIEVRVSSIKPSVREAQESVESVSSRLLGELCSLGLTPTNIETASYNLYPRYEWEKHSSVFKGYQASHTLRIKTDDLSGRIDHLIRFEASI